MAAVQDGGSEISDGGRKPAFFVFRWD